MQARRQIGQLCLLAAGIIARVQAFGAGGLAQFCFDDLAGIAASGLQTCQQVKGGGHCRTESYSKFCHKTCLICTQGARVCFRSLRMAYLIERCCLLMCRRPRRVQSGRRRQ